jgi:hypothetical protein
MTTPPRLTPGPCSNREYSICTYTFGAGSDLFGYPEFRGIGFANASFLRGLLDLIDIELQVSYGIMTIILLSWQAICMIFINLIVTIPILAIFYRIEENWNPRRWSMHEIKDHFPKLLMIILLQFLFASVPSAAFAGEIYKWRDKNGNVFFSDAPPALGDSEVITLKEERAPNPGTRPKVNSAKPKGRSTDEKRPYGSIKVIMYKTSWCGYCRKAREYVQSLRVNLVEYDVERDRSMSEEMLRKSRGARGAP